MATRTQLAGGRWDRLSYLTSALAIAAIIFAGFSRTFYLNSFFAKMYLPPVLLFHGFVFTAWIVLLIVQTSLIAARRITVHRRLGIAGGALAALMVVAGLMATIYSADAGSQPQTARLLWSLWWSQPLTWWCFRAWLP